MAWNEPGGNKNPWGKRPGQDGQNVDEAFKNFQRKLENLLKGGSGGGGAGGGAGAAPEGSGSVFALAGLLALAGWVYMSTFQVGAAERGVVQRFGRFVDVREPGLGWHWWPLEQVTKVNVSEVRSLEYSSRVLTADINLIELSLGVQYQLRDPVRFLFQIREPEQTLREVSESAIREAVGQTKLDDIIVGNRQAITTRTRDLIQRTMDQYNSGINVSSVNLTDIQVPEAVVPAQRDANKAIADKERFRQEAEAYSSGIIPVAEGQASRQLQEAEGYKAQVVAIAEGEAARFTQLQAAYAAAPRVTRERLYIEGVESVLSKSRKVIVDSKGGNQMLYLPLDRMLERAVRDNETTVTAPRPVSEPESSATTDARARGDR
ncbi:MAG: FtsH protease activity modulator HflK [Steroidobacteraceae bacterium]